MHAPWRRSCTNSSSSAARAARGSSRCAVQPSSPQLCSLVHAAAPALLAAALPAADQPKLQATQLHEPPPPPPTRQQQHLRWQAEDRTGMTAASGACRTTSSSSSSSSKRRSLQQLSLHELQQRLGSRPSAATEDPALLTAAIKACSSVQQAAALYSEHSAAFNHIHTAALISHLPKVLVSAQLQRLTPQQHFDLAGLLEDISQLAEEVLPACRGRELANIAQGFASLGFYSRRLMQLLLCRCQLSGLQPQELANLAWAVAKLQHGVHEGWVAELLSLSQELMRTDSLRPQEVCNIAWALAVLQRRCLLEALPPFQASCTPVDAAWKAEFCRTVTAQITACNAADVAMALWALAVMGHGAVEQQWLKLMLARAGQLMAAADGSRQQAGTGGMQGRHVSTVLWATHQLQQQQRQQQQQQLLVRPEASAASPSLDDASEGLNSSTGRLASGNDCSSSLRQFWGACQPKLQQLLLLERQHLVPDGASQPQPQLKLTLVLLLSLSRLQIQPPAERVQELLAPVAAQLRRFAEQRGQQLCSGATTSATLHEILGDTGSSISSNGGSSALQISSSSSSRSSHDIRLHNRRQHQQRVQLADVTLLLYSLARLSYRPSDAALAAAVAAASVCCWELLQQQEEQRSRHQQQQPPPSAATAVRGQELALLLWALVKLRHRPPPLFLVLVTRAAAACAGSFSASELGLLFWAMGKMRHRPSLQCWVRPMLQQLLVKADDCLVAGPAISLAVWALPLMPRGSSLRWQQQKKRQLGLLLPQLAAAAAMRLGECGPRELVQLMLGFARLGFRPSAQWMAQHRARVMELVAAEKMPSRERQVIGAAVVRLLMLPSPDPCYECHSVVKDGRQIQEQSCMHAAEVAKASADA